MKRVVILLPVLLAFQVGVQPAFAWTWPVEGPVLRPFNLGADPYAGGQHRGIDIGAPLGAAVVAPAGGKVTFAGTVPTGGRTIAIRTADGYSVTLLQLGAVDVARDQEVAEGDVVGVIGPSGEAELPEPHVYLGIRLAADPHGYLDPLGFLPPQASGSDAVADPALAPTPVQAGGRGAEKDEPARPGPERVSSTSDAVKGVAEAPRRRLGHMIRLPAPVRLWARHPLPSTLEPRVGSTSVSAASRPAEDRSAALWPFLCVAVALGPALAVLRRKLRDARAAHRASAVLLERLVAPAEDTDRLRFRQEDRLVLDRDLEGILLAEAEALADLDRNHDPAELVDVADDSRPRHSSRRACRRADRLPRAQRVLPSRPSVSVSL
jgi:Peptidase family M23